MEDIKTSSWVTKGFDGPPDNYLPNRLPVESINPEVVKRMKGFGFGSDQEITSKIDDFLKCRAPKTPLESMKSGSSFFNFSPHVKGLGRALIHRNERGRNPLPESSLVSIYYLVAEKMEREYRKLQLQPKTTITSPVFSSQAKLDDVGRSSMDEIRPQRRASMDDDRFIDADEAGNIDDDNRLSDDEAQVIFSAPSSPSFGRRSVDIIIESQHKRYRRIRPRASSMGEIPPSLQNASEVKAFKNSSESGGRKRRFKIRNTKAKASTIDLDSAATTLQDEIESEPDHTTPGSKKLASNIVSAVKKRFIHFSGSRTRSSQLDPIDTSGASSPPSPTKELRDITSDPEDGLASSSASGRGFNVPRVHTTDESHQKLRGKFVISKNRVRGDRSRLGKRLSMAKFSKGSNSDNNPDAGSSSASYTPIAIIKYPGESPTPATGRGQVDSAVKSVFLKGLFSVATSSTKSTGSIRRELLRVFELLSIEFKESAGVFECRFVDLSENSDPHVGIGGRVVQTENFNVDSSGVGINASGETWRSVVFEVYIVKIGWISIHGVRFRRISGNIWQYKKICNRILEETKL